MRRRMALVVLVGVSAIPTEYAVTDREIPSTGGCAHTDTGTAPLAMVAVAEATGAAPPLKYDAGNGLTTCGDP